MYARLGETNRFAGIALLSILVWFLRIPLSGLLRPTASDLALLEDPNCEDEILVEITIYQGTRPTFRDRGIITVQDDCLLFVGHRTSFAVGSQDLENGRTSKKLRDIVPSNAACIRLRHHATEITLSLVAVPLNARSYRRSFRLLGRMIGQFQSSIAPTQIARTYPPLVPDRSGDKVQIFRI